ncbi:MAG: response regulator [Parcubacteria group bacterium]|nr:response regulator [Parcubacteria group bacterium]
MVEKKKKILFIEDEATLQKAIGTFLEAEGYEIISVLDGEAGIARANKDMPDLILLDLILPKKDGFEVLAELKTNEATKKIPVIVLTNLEGIGYVDRAIELGATTYLVKANYTLEEVIQKVKEALA